MFSQIRRVLIRRHPSAFLLIAQILLLILYALFDGFHSQRAIISAFNVLIYSVVVVPLDRTHNLT